jgi:hypothetical protein
MQLGSEGYYGCVAGVYQPNNKIQSNLGFVAEFEVSASGGADSIYFFVGANAIPWCESGSVCHEGGFTVIMDIYSG